MIVKQKILKLISLSLLLTITFSGFAQKTQEPKQEPKYASRYFVIGTTIISSACLCLIFYLRERSLKENIKKEYGNLGKNVNKIGKEQKNKSQSNQEVNQLKEQVTDLSNQLKQLQEALDTGKANKDSRESQSGDYNPFNDTL